VTALEERHAVCVQDWALAYHRIRRTYRSALGAVGSDWLAREMGTLGRLRPALMSDIQGAERSAEQATVACREGTGTLDAFKAALMRWERLMHAASRVLMGCCHGCAQSSEIAVGSPSIGWRYCRACARARGMLR
jgi:hypothetical protein